MPRIWTVGHSNRSLDAFLDLLVAKRIEAICDVRAFPSSKRWPHFKRDALAAALQARGLRYHWMGKELGGYRKARPDSPHAALGTLRGYADHMHTELFRSGIRRLLSAARETRTACMCAEAHWRDCHRRLLADWLALTEGASVVHIEDLKRTEEHAPDPRAREVEGRLVFDVGAQKKLF